MEICKLVGYNVKRHRLRCGFSQEELAARMGVNQAYVSKLESGKLNPTVSTVALTARALDIDTILLFLIPHPGDQEKKILRGRDADFLPPLKKPRSRGTINKR